MKEQRRVRLTEEFRGKMNEEAGMIIEYLKSMENRLDQRLDEIKQTLTKTTDLTQENEKKLISHTEKIKALEENCKELKESNKEQHTDYYSRIGVLENAQTVDDSKRKGIPNIISIISLSSTIVMGIIMYLLTRGK